MGNKATVFYVSGFDKVVFIQLAYRIFECSADSDIDVFMDLAERIFPAYYNLFVRHIQSYGRPEEIAFLVTFMRQLNHYAAADDVGMEFVQLP